MNQCYFPEAAASFLILKTKQIGVEFKRKKILTSLGREEYHIIPFFVPSL